MSRSTISTFKLFETPPDVESARKYLEGRLWPNGDRYRCSRLEGILDRIAHKDNANGALLANYVAKYFEDIWQHLKGLTKVLAAKARVHYIVGNSTFYGVLLPVEEFYAEILRELGFADVGIRAIRKRNSKKELVEFDVSGSWGAAR